jgi:hypothetical protein
MLRSDFVSAAFLLNGYNCWRVRHDAHTLGAPTRCRAATSSGKPTPATTRTKPGRRRCSRKTRRIAFNVARLPGLLGEADEDRKLKADQAERLGKKLTVHVG